MVRERKRRRRLARAKWERQNAKRVARARRERIVGWVFGGLAAVLLAGGVVWFIMSASSSDANKPTGPSLTTPTASTSTTSTSTTAPSNTTTSAPTSAAP